MRKVLHSLLTCIIMACGICVQLHLNAKIITLTSEKEKGESISGVKSQKYFVIDSAKWENDNPGKTDTFSTNVITLRPQSFGIFSNYSIPFLNKYNGTIKIDSITFSGTRNDFEPNQTIILDSNIQEGFYFEQVIKFLHNTPGSVECILTIHSNLEQLIPGIDINTANPSFTLKGFVNASNLTYKLEGCDYYYLNANSNCQCSYKITLQNEGRAKVFIDSIVFVGNKNHYIFTPDLNDLKSRKTLGIDSLDKFYSFGVKFSPLQNNPGTYSGSLLVFSDLKKDPSLVIDISYESIKPELKLMYPDTVLVNPGDEKTIPISFEVTNIRPGDEINFIRELQISLPPQSNYVLAHTRFDIDPSVSAQTEPKSAYRPPFDENPDSEFQKNRLFINNNTFTYFANDSIDYKWYMKDKIGALSFRYYLSEYPNINISIDTITLGNFSKCFYFSFSDIKIPIIKYPDECDFISQDSFFVYVRSKEPYLNAAMRVSSEPVMEIQHYLQEPMQTEISLYSISGMKLETIFSGLAKAELQQFRHPMSHLPPGVYFCEMIAGQFRKTVPILLSR